MSQPKSGEELRKKIRAAIEFGKTYPPYVVMCRANFARMTALVQRPDNALVTDACAEDQP